jgi:hypothetical protein
VHNAGVCGNNASLAVPGNKSVLLRGNHVQFLRTCGHTASIAVHGNNSVLLRGNHEHFLCTFLSQKSKLLQNGSRFCVWIFLKMKARAKSLGSSHVY